MKTATISALRVEKKLRESAQSVFAKLSKVALIKPDSCRGNPVSFEAFKTVYEVLGDKLRPQVYELGFMKY